MRQESRRLAEFRCLLEPIRQLDQNRFAPRPPKTKCLLATAHESATTFTLGYPVTAANSELLRQTSRRSRSVSHAAAGRRNDGIQFVLVHRRIDPFLPASSWFFLIASTYSAWSAALFLRPSENSLAQNGISFAAFFSLNSITSFSILTGAFGPSHASMHSSPPSAVHESRNSVSPNLPYVSIPAGRSASPLLLYYLERASINLSTAGLNPNAFAKHRYARRATVGLRNLV